MILTKALKPFIYMAWSAFEGIIKTQFYPDSRPIKALDCFASLAMTASRPVNIEALSEAKQSRDLYSL